MDIPTLNFVFDRKKVATREKRGLLQMEIKFRRVRKFATTGIKLYADQWDDRRMVINTIDSPQLNMQLSDMRLRFDEYISATRKNGRFFDERCVERIIAVLNGEDPDNGESYIDFVERRISERGDIRESTRRAQSKFPGALREFGLIQRFSDLTPKNIREFDKWLHGRSYKQTTVYSYHKFNKTYINEAVRDGIIDKSPYVGLKIDRGRSDKRKYLLPEELRRIEDAEIPDSSIARVRDLFVFQCYTGLAYADLSKFDFSKAEKRNGRYVLSDRRQKTNEDYSIVLLSPAVRILEKYGGVLPVISNQQYNLRLKVLESYAGLDKGLTSHVGRHTFAVMALNNGVRIEHVAKMLGHADIATTQIYAKILAREVEKDFDMLEKKIGKGL